MTVVENLPEWLRPTPTGSPIGPHTIRVAFLGRTSTDDQQDPTLSLPRQLTSCERALLPNMEIALRFYDVETSRKELTERGSSTAWTKFNIPIVRDGGLADLLAEAASPDRRFDVVMCESIDRIARFTHQGTKIEHDLELLGVPLLASDEPIIFDGQPGRKRKKASSILLRRTKQGVAEWYIVEMLEKSWDGFEQHTIQGWNVGKPPYGYLAERHKHPVPAKRAEGKHKTKLKVDPDRGPVVELIYALRVNDKLSYRAIADRLNTDLHRYRPPEPVDPERAVGRWTGSAVREILFNPKYTGHMCWNRRSSKDKMHPGKNNPVDEWIVSAQPTHPGIITIETFLAAQNVASARQRSRADATPGTRNRHRQTRRVYALRSYVWCAPCARRMFGREVPGGYTYYTCQPRERALPAGHPRNLSLREDHLLTLIDRFFNTHVFGTDRINLAARSASVTAQQAAEEHQRKITAVRRAIHDLEARRRRVFRILETQDDDDGSLLREAKERRAELDAEHRLKVSELEHLEQTMPEGGAGAVELLTDLPLAQVNLADLPADTLRSFLDAFAVQISYDLHRDRATLRATISGDAVPNLTRVTRTAIPRQHTAHHTLTSKKDDAPASNGGGE
ncbi:MAG TPA: recombinase family protein, partial [Catenuloplanes sp.]